MEYFRTVYLSDINMCNTPLGEPPPLVNLYGDICQREASTPRIIIISPRTRAIFMEARWRYGKRYGRERERERA